MLNLRKLMATVLCVIALAPTAHASLIFSFSFDKSRGQGETPHPITGEIHGLEEKSGRQTPLKVILTSVGELKKFEHLLPIDVLGVEWTFDKQSIFFEVSDKKIVGWNFNSFHEHLPVDSILFDWLDLGSKESGSPFSGFSFLSVGYNESGPKTERTASSDAPAFLLLNGIEVPAPSVLLLLAIGLAGMRVTRHRQRTPVSH